MYSLCFSVSPCEMHFAFILHLVSCVLCLPYNSSTPSSLRQTLHSYKNRANRPCLCSGCWGLPAHLTPGVGARKQKNRNALSSTCPCKTAPATLCFHR